MTRTEFIKAYAKRSGSHAEYADLGIYDIAGWPGHAKIALPCACGDDKCKGWAMIGIEGIDHHLSFNAPDPLRQAYCEATKDK